MILKKANSKLSFISLSIFFFIYTRKNNTNINKYIKKYIKK